MKRGYLKAAHWQIAALDEEQREWDRAGFRTSDFPAAFSIGFVLGVLVSASVVILSLEYWVK